MFAEKVFDGSFEGVPPYKFAFRSQTDRVEQPWYPDGARTSRRVRARYQQSV